MAEDAECLLAYMRRLVSEPDNNVPLNVGELPNSSESQVQAIEGLASIAGSALLLCFSGNELVGRLDINGSRRDALAHVVSFGVSVDASYRRKGLGRALIAAGLGWANARPAIRRIEIEVHERNRAAIALYEEFDFVVEGRCVGRLFQHGKYHDTLLMARNVA